MHDDGLQGRRRDRNDDAMPDLSSIERHILTERYTQYRQRADIARDLGMIERDVQIAEMAAITKLGLTYAPTAEFDLAVRSALDRL